MAIDFLCTRVRIPDEDYWGKLVRVLPLILGSESMIVIKWWVSASFVAHP